MDYIRRLLFSFPKRKSVQKHKPELKIEKPPNKSALIVVKESADKEKRLNEETSFTSIPAYLRRLFGYSERKPAQKRKREENGGITDRSSSNAEDESASKKKRQNEEISGISLDEVKCRICLDVVCSSVMSSLPCAHVFHESCLFQWLEISRVCPLCRYPTTDDTDDDYIIPDIDMTWIMRRINQVTNMYERQRETHESDSDRSIDESPPQRRHTTHSMNSIFNSMIIIDLNRLNDAILSSEDETNEHEYQPESHESASDGSNGESAQEGTSSESQHDGSSDESLQDGANGESSSVLSRDESVSNGLNGYSPREGWPNTVYRNETLNALIFGPDEELDFWNLKTPENESRRNRNEFQPLSHESGSERSSDEYPPDGSSIESQPNVSNVESPPDISSIDSQPNVSNGKSPPDGSSSESQPNESNGESPQERSSGESKADGSDCELKLDRLKDDVAQNRLNGETTEKRSCDIAHSDGRKKGSPPLNVVMITVK